MLDQTTGSGAQGATKRADDPGGDGVLKPVRISECDDQLPGSQCLLIANLDRGEVGRGDSNHRDVAVAVLTNQIRLTLATVRQRDVNP